MHVPVDLGGMRSQHLWSASVSIAPHRLVVYSVERNEILLSFWRYGLRSYIMWHSIEVPPNHTQASQLGQQKIYRNVKWLPTQVTSPKWCWSSHFPELHRCGFWQISLHHRGEPRHKALVQWGDKSMNTPENNPHIASLFSVLVSLIRPLFSCYFIHGPLYSILPIYIYILRV